MINQRGKKKKEGKGRKKIKRERKKRIKGNRKEGKGKVNWLIP